jgi:cation diffusion facilitator family transporter
MTNLLIRLFIKHPEDMTEQNRYNYGKLAGGTGIACNVILFAVKLLIGVFSSSVAIIADAFNNLSDAGSSVVTLFGFKLSAAPADKEHPFGHGRMEYLSALAVAALIMVAGFELAGSSIEKIIAPVLPEFNLITLCILAVAIGVKLWMAFFYRNIGKRIRSDALMASYTDSRNDVLCTAVVLVASLVSWRFQIALDGYVGVAVSAFVLWSGFSVMKETVSPLLGQAPDPELVRDIIKTVLSFDGVTGVHDLIVHNYGPGRVIVSLHAEVPCRTDMMKSHDTIDLVERELMEKYNVLACIHMDPVDTEDERVQELRKIAQTVLQEVDPALSLHDFRVVHGETHTNLIFDMVFPFDKAKEKDALVLEIAKRIHAVDSHLYAVITAEQSYI